MSSFTSHGDATVVQQSSVTFGPAGWQTVIPIEGERSAIDALYALYQASGLTCSITPLAGPSARLEVTYIGSGGVGSETEAPIVTEWKLTTAGAVVPIEEHYDFVAAVDRMKLAYASQGQNAVDLALRTLKEYISGTDATTLTDGVVIYIQTPANGLIGFIELILGGTKSFQRGEPTVQVQRRYQPTASYYPSLAVVNTVYTTASMVAVIDPPDGLISKLPNGDWLCDHVEYDYSSDGSRVEMQSFKYAPTISTLLYPDRA